MVRKESVTMYLDEEQKEEIKAEAERAGVSVSTYCRDLVQQKRMENAQEDVSDHLSAEERLEAVMADGLDSIVEVTAGLREQHGLIIHILREIEDDLEGVTVETKTDTDTANGEGGDLMHQFDNGNSDHE